MIAGMICGVLIFVLGGLVGISVYMAGMLRSKDKDKVEDKLI